MDPGKLAERRLSSADSKKFLQEIAMNYEEGQIFLTAIEIGIFTKLIEPKSAKNLAEELGTDSRLTARILDVLVSFEVLKKREEIYTTSPMLAPFLLEGSPASFQSLSYSHKEGTGFKNKNLFEEKSCITAVKTSRETQSSDLIEGLQ